MTRRTWALAVVAFLGLAAVVGAACSAATTASKPQSAPVRAPAGKSVLPATGVQLGPAQSEDQGAAAGVAVLGQSLPGIQQRIVKTAGVSLQVKKGTFAQQVQQASLIAARHGGYVASSQTTQDKFQSGTLVLRIPADQFEQALAELKGLGNLQSQNISGVDVTGQFVDLQARLRNWEAQESVLLRLMSRATTIDDSIKVQRQLQDVQLAIEEIRGQLHVLSDQADLATISLTMAEVGAVPVQPRPMSTLAKAWHQAAHGFTSVIASVVVGLGYLVPLGLLALVLAAAWRLGSRRRRADVAPTIAG